MNPAGNLLLACAILCCVSAPLSAQNQWTRYNGAYQSGALKLTTMPNGKLLQLNEYALYLSDRGERWTKIKSTADLFDCTHFRYYGDVGVGEDNTIYLHQCPDMVLRSHDNGTTWDTTYISPASDHCSQMLIADDGTIFMFNPNAMNISTDGGDTWTSEQVNPPQYYQDVTEHPSGVVLRVGLGISGITYENGVVLIRLINDDVPGRHILALPNGDVVMNSRYSRLDDSGCRISISHDTCKTWTTVYEDSLHVQTDLIRTASGILYACGEQLLQSSDAGMTWSPQNAIPVDDIVSITENANGDLLITTRSDGTWKSTDNGANWRWASAGLESPVLGLKQIGTQLFAATPSGWRVIPEMDDAPVPIVDWPVDISGAQRTSNGTIFGAEPDAVRLSTDDGQTWKLTPSLPPAVVEFHCSPSGVLLVRVPGGATVYSSDGGSSWTGITGQVQFSEIIDIPGGVLVQLSGSPGENLYTTDNGKTWTRLERVFLADIALSDNTLLNIPSFALNNNVQRSADYGATWELLSMIRFGDDFENSTIRSIRVDPNNVIYCVTEAAVGNVANRPSLIYRSIDKGVTWERLSGTPVADIRDLAFLQDGRAIIATCDGMYTGGFTTGIEGGNFKTAESFLLLPAYPNPAGGTTSFQYTLSVPQYISLDVYNTLGRKVYTLYNGLSESGTYSILLDASTLPSGTYRVVLRSGEGLQTQMVVVR